MDWINWVPLERANLCFICQDDHVLLIRKKRGLGAGKVNAPGGKIEAGETPLAAVIRETEEEICVTPSDLREMGDLSFQFADGYSLFCHVYVAHHFEGEPAETAEAEPFWVPIDRIPYGEMWSDDAHWLPLMLEGRRFRGFFEFDGDRMVSHRLDDLDKWVTP